MRENYCADCRVEGIPDPDVPNRWECPQCHRHILSHHAHDEFRVTQAAGLQGASSEVQDGIPVREVARYVAEDGRGSGVDIERDASDNSRAQRTMHPVGPAPRDPQGRRKQADEQEAVRVLLPTFNRLHGTAYETIGRGVDAHGDDVIAQSPRKGEPPVRFQVTFADTDHELRKSISLGKPFAAEGTEEQLLARAAAAFREKVLAPDRSAVLVLDGGGVVTAPGTVERFARENRDGLATAPFREVWWVDHAPGGVVRRLAPEA
jgi:hypothetical protein